MSVAGGRGSAGELQLFEWGLWDGRGVCVQCGLGGEYQRHAMRTVRAGILPHIGWQLQWHVPLSLSLTHKLILVRQSVNLDARNAQISLGTVSRVRRASRRTRMIVRRVCPHSPRHRAVQCARTVASATVRRVHHARLHARRAPRGRRTTASYAVQGSTRSTGLVSRRMPTAFARVPR